MSDNELRRLNRSELLQMLIDQMEENKQLQERLEQAESKLGDRQIMIDKAGSIAEASMAVNEVFQAAESAAQQYLDNIRRMSTEQEAVCRELQEKAEARAAEIEREAQEYSSKAHAEADAYWQEVRSRAEALVRDQDALRELVMSGGRNSEE